MAAEHVEYLDLTPEQIRATARFHEAYAATAVQELESFTPNRISRPIEDETAFTLIADAASALREAGQWALLLDPERAGELLRQSGALFLRLGQAFGVYLGVVTTGWEYEMNHGLLARVLRSAMDAPIDRTAEDEPRVLRQNPMPDIRLQQQQQAYLVIAAGCIAGRTETAVLRAASADPLDTALAAMLEISPHRSGVLPVGSLGTPIHRFWSVAEHLFRGEHTDAEGIARHIVAMCRSYEEAISLARANRYLWRNGAAPVDVADLDISGIAAMTTRNFGEDALRDALAEVPGGRDLSRIAQVPIELGIALASGPDVVQ
ncbi:hypothetical protein [Amycolatopsis kentuckyensis]|uniref:hypothetical protein n=1 Tax=Amycolatopsis kentuckyensis TaxID=218823 RepID=UPI000A3BE865|nr:hypothetical protein [Amycolatopsis kentuckyensis]